MPVSEDHYNSKTANLRKSHFETFLNLLQDPLVLLAAHKRDGQTLGTEPTGTTHTVQVRVCVRGQIIVDGKVDSLDIDTTAEHVSGNADTLVELLEFLVAFDTASS